MNRLLLAATALAPLLASAQPAAEETSARASRVSLFARAGAALVRNGDLEALGFDAGPALEAGVAVRLLPHLGVEAGAGYLTLAARQSSVVRSGTSPGDPLLQVDGERRLSAVPVVGSLRASVRAGSVEFSALVGGGLYVTSLATSWRDSAGGGGSSSDTDTSFGLHVGAAIAATPSPRTTVGLDARLLWSEATFEPPALSTTRPASVDTALDSLLLSATFAYRL